AHSAFSFGYGRASRQIYRGTSHNTSLDDICIGPCGGGTYRENCVAGLRSARQAEASNDAFTKRTVGRLVAQVGRRGGRPEAFALRLVAIFRERAGKETAGSELRYR